VTSSGTLAGRPQTIVNGTISTNQGSLTVTNIPSEYVSGAILWVSPTDLSTSRTVSITPVIDNYQYLGGRLLYNFVFEAETTSTSSTSSTMGDSTMGNTTTV